MSDGKNRSPGRLLQSFALSFVGARVGVALSLLGLFLSLRPETNGLTPSQIPNDGLQVSPEAVIAKTYLKAKRAKSAG